MAADRRDEIKKIAARLLRLAAEMDRAGRSEDAAAILAGAVAFNMDALEYARRVRDAGADANESIVIKLD